MAINYNFQAVKYKKQEEQEQGIQEAPKADPRKGIKISKACGNCKFYWYLHNNTRTGLCKLPAPKGVIKQTSASVVDHEEIEALGWLPTHSTLVCKKWKPSIMVTSRKQYARTTGLVFLENRDLAPEELQTTELGINATKSK